MTKTTEKERLEAAKSQNIPWRKWGPYLSDRQRGTVREDYSEGGDAWNYFTHDHARSRAYRWGADGTGGFCDDEQRVGCAAAPRKKSEPVPTEQLYRPTDSDANTGAAGE